MTASDWLSDQRVGNILCRQGIAPARERKRTTTWSQFIRSHMAVLAGTDFFTVEVLTWRGLVTYYVLFFLHLETRRVTIAGITDEPEVLLFPCGEVPTTKRGPSIRCHERLGGLLKYYYRKAA